MELLLEPPPVIREEMLVAAPVNVLLSEELLPAVPELLLRVEDEVAPLDDEELPMVSGDSEEE